MNTREHLESITMNHNHDENVRCLFSYITLVCPEICPRHVNLAEEYVVLVLDAVRRLKRYAIRVHLSIYLAHVISKRMEITPIRITDDWENVLWRMVKHAKHWRPEQNIDYIMLGPACFRSWILRLYTDHTLCPNKFLRLEMIRFIGMWPETYLQNADFGMQTTAGLVASIAYMDVDHLFGLGHKLSLLYFLDKVLHSLHKYGFLDAVSAAAVDQVSSLKTGPEMIFFTSLIRLLSRKAKETVRTCIFRSAANIFDYILHMVRLLLVKPSTMMAFQCPGLAHIAAASLVTIASSVVVLRTRRQSKHHIRYVSLTAELDDIFLMIFTRRKFSTLARVLHHDHAQSLSSINENADFSYNNFLKPHEESTGESPEEFVDSVTQEVMESPVLLQSSKMMVDESTLVQLLLESPYDPFTRSPLDPGSYNRLPDLQADILAWKITSGGNHDTHDIGSDDAIDNNTEKDGKDNNESSNDASRGKIFEEFKGDRHHIMCCYCERRDLSSGYCTHEYIM